MIRRLFFLCAALLAVSPLQAARPNFVFIYTDDQRWDAMSVVQREQGESARFPWFQTPHLDRLAAEGVRFRNAFVTMSLCAPSRAAFLTGRYNHANGVPNNHTPFPQDNVTYASLLKTAGYRTGYTGKWHMGKQAERPGFDFSASFLGQGKYFDCPIVVNGKETTSKGWVDDVTTDYAIDFLKQSKDQPFALVIGFKSCHGPFDPPERAKDRFANEEARAVPNLTAPAIYRDGVKEKPKKAQRKAKAEPGAKVKTNLGYFRCLSAMDENVGRVLAALDELKLAENTVVVFTSDNGYYLGEHGLGDKRTAYEEAMRIPMLVRWPASSKAGRTIDELVLNIDIAPTFLEMAGVPVPAGMQGRSWVPLLAGQANEWRKSFFYEYFQERGFGAPTVLAVRTAKAKLIKYPGHDEWTELFDLQADRYETKNLAADPAYRELLTQMQAEFERQAQAVAYRLPAESEPAPVVPAKEAREVLDFDFTKPAQGAVIADVSGAKNAGKARSLTFTEGRAGKQAAKFDGHAVIEVGKAPSLDPSNSAWTIEATIKADQPNGVIVARGGQSQGYSLYLREGRPTFTVTANNRAKTIEGQEAITGQWKHLAAAITKDQRIALYVDGALKVSQPLPSYLTKDPNDGLQIGNDTGSQVIAYPGGSAFNGLIERVQLYSGERPATDLKSPAPLP